MNKKAIGLIKDKLHGKTMYEFTGLRVKTYSYLINDGSENKKSKRYKNVCHKKN